MTGPAAPMICTVCKTAFVEQRPRSRQTCGLRRTSTPPINCSSSTGTPYAELDGDEGLQFLATHRGVVTHEHIPGARCGVLFVETAGLPSSCAAS
jgi:hypothetical protein